MRIEQTAGDLLAIRGGPRRKKRRGRRKPPGTSGYGVTSAPHRAPRLGKAQRTTRTASARRAPAAGAARLSNGIALRARCSTQLSG